MSGIAKLLRSAVSRAADQRDIVLMIAVLNDTILACRGRIQLAVKRAFAAAGTTMLTTSDVFDYALARHRQDQWRRRHRWSVVRVLRQMCDPVGRSRGAGRPWLWRLKSPAAETPSAP
jgi:hypothetical protein